MDELMLFRAERPAAGGLGEEDRAAAREQLLAAIVAEAAEPYRAAAPRRVRRTGRPGARWRQAAAVALAAAAAITVVVTTGVVRSSPAGRGRDQEAASTAPVLRHRTAAGLTGSDVLMLAARRAAAVPTLKVSPGQFLFVKGVSKDDPYERNGVGETWASWDGRHGGLTYTPAYPRPYDWWPDCVQHPASYNAALFSCPMPLPFATNYPRTVQGMLALFSSTGTTQLCAARPTPALRQAAIAEAAVWLLQGPESPPGNGLLYSNSTEALMYNAAATLADVDVVSNAVTVTGQHGIGIATVEAPYLGCGGPTYGIDGSAAGSYLVELVFDPTTFQQIGEDYYPLHGYFAPSGGLLGSGFHGSVSAKFGGSAVLQTAVVGRNGELPPG